MTDNKKVSRRLILTAASVLPLSACVGTIEGDSEVEGVRILGLTGDTKVSNVTKFRLDLIAGAGQDPAANWYSIDGAGITTKPAVYSKDSGDIEFEEVQLVGPFVSGGTRADLLKILNEWATGKGTRYNATLELLDSSNNVVRTMNFWDYSPVEYVPPSVRAGNDTLLEERFSFKPERIEIM